MERRRGSGEDRHVDRGGDRGGTRNKDTWCMSVKEEAKFFDKRGKKKIFSQRNPIGLHLLVQNTMQNV